MSYPIAVLALRSAIVIGSSMGYTAGLCQSAVSVGGLLRFRAYFSRACSLVVLEACATRTSSSLFGKARPLFRARFKIPSHALRLNEYADGGAGSKMSDKKETAASLGHSEELRIEYAPCQTVPELVHFGQELSESLPILA